MTEADLPMPIPLLLGLVGLVGTLGGAAIAALSKKWRTPADNREDRKVALEADEALLGRFQALLAERDKRLDEVVEELKEVRKIAEAATRDNRILVDWCYAVVRIVRDLGGIHLLPTPPRDVIIFDHPSYHQEEGS